MSTLFSLKWGVSCILNGMSLTRTFKWRAEGVDQCGVLSGTGIAKSCIFEPKYSIFMHLGRAWEGKGGVMRGAVVYCFL